MSPLVVILFIPFTGSNNIADTIELLFQKSTEIQKSTFVPVNRSVGSAF